MENTLVENIPLNAKVICEDGVCGRTTSVILDPKTLEVTHIVVRERKIPNREWIVPIDQVKELHLNRICLDCTRGDLITNKPFNAMTWVEREVLQETIPLPRGRSVPHRDGGKVYVQKTREQIPPDEVAIHNGAEVTSISDEWVNGKAVAFQINSNSHQISNLIIRSGFPWNRRQFSISASHIKYFGDHTIYLVRNDPTPPARS